MDVLDRDAIEDELEVVDGAYDGGVEAVGEDLGGEGVWGLEEEDGAGDVVTDGMATTHDARATCGLTPLVALRYNWRWWFLLRSAPLESCRPTLLRGRRR